MRPSQKVDFYVLAHNRVGAIVAASIVDPDVAVAACRHRWRIHPDGYLIRSGPRSEKPRRTILLHRVAIDAQAGDVVDHVSGDRLDNRCANLRIASMSQNGANRAAPSSNTSGVKGVRWEPDRGTWLARITVNRRMKNLGRFRDLTDAVSAYNAAAQLYFGEFARPAYRPIAES